MTHAKGADLSHWQTDQAFANVLRWADFVAIKAGDGGSVASDPEFKERWAQLDKALRAGTIECRIAYQWLRGSGGAPAANALVYAMGTALRNRSLGAFDYEDPKAGGWELLAAVKRYQAVTGRKSLVYGGSKLRSLPYLTRVEVAKHAFLWLADWDTPYPTIAPWPTWRFLQYHGIGLDLDEYNGDVAALRHWLGVTTVPAWPKVYLKLGVRHWSVKTWAARLKQLGYSPAKYGYTISPTFGRGKVRATKAFQKKKGLTTDGIVGPKTWNAAW